MIPSPVQCVLFDAVGTLIYADPPVSAVYAAAGQDFGIALDEASVERRFVRAFRKHYLAARDGDDTTNETIERNRWRQVVASVFPEISPCEAIFERLWEHFARPTSWRLFDDVADCWRRLIARGLVVGIASNFDARLDAICSGLPPLNACQHVFTSSRIGFRKQAGQFFQSIERTVGLARRQLLLVGDDWEADYLAATAANWHAIHLNRAENTQSAASIRSLAELS